MLKHCNPIKHGLTSSTLSKLGFQILNCVLGEKKKKRFSGKAGFKFTFMGTRPLTTYLSEDTRHTVLELFYNQAKKGTGKK